MTQNEYVEKILFSNLTKDQKNTALELTAYNSKDINECEEYFYVECQFFVKSELRFWKKSLRVSVSTKKFTKKLQNL